MLECEGYKMFYGIMRVRWANGNSESIEGTWLYKPDYDIWYCKGRSYIGKYCEIALDMGEPK